jgi:uncharacterized SAM-binding protein YcdF (DUF218 family)
MTGRSDRARSLLIGLAVGGLVGVLALDLDLHTLVSYWGQRAPLAVAAAVAGAALWRTRVRLLVAGAAAALSLLWLAVAFTPLCAWLADGLVRRDRLEPADAVLVLASGVQLDGEPTAGALSRLVHGLELVRGGHASRLVLSEIRPPAASAAPYARALMGRLGIEGELIVVGPISRTRDEALAVSALVRQRGWKRVLAVTSPVHSRRSCEALEREGVSAISSPAVETHYDLERLTRPDDRRAAFGSLIHEWVGLWVYRRRGWI